MQQAGIDVGLSGVKFCLAMSPWISPMTDLPLDAGKLDVSLLITGGKRDSEAFQRGFKSYRDEFKYSRYFEHDGTHEYSNQS